MIYCRLVVLLIASLLLTMNVQSQGIVHGYTFGDFFYKAQGDDTSISRSQYAGVEKGTSALQFRRFYLYYDQDISEKFFARFLIEGNDGTFSGSSHTLFVKAAYLQWRNIIQGHDLFFGRVSTPSWSMGYPESVWGYRSVEKTITDFRGLGTSTDIGIAMRGTLSQQGKVGYAVLYGTRNSLQYKDKDFRTVYAFLNAEPVKGLLLEAYVDRWMTPDDPAYRTLDRTTFKGFAAYRTDSFTIGTEIIHQTRHRAGPNEQDRTPFGLTFFARAPVAEKLNAFGRVDLFNPDTKIDNTGFTETFLLFGLDYRPVPNVWIMPNIWINAFSQKSNETLSKDTDIVARLTLFYRYR